MNEKDIKECRECDYDKIEKTVSNDNTVGKSNEWFKDLSNKNFLVTCTKYKGRFHKKHCKIIKYIENIEELNQMEDITSEMEGCDSFKCNIAAAIKSIQL